MFLILSHPDTFAHTAPPPPARMLSPLGSKSQSGIPRKPSLVSPTSAPGPQRTLSKFSDYVNISQILILPSLSCLRVGGVFLSSVTSPPYYLRYSAWHMVGPQFLVSLLPFQSHSVLGIWGSHGHRDLAASWPILRGWQEVTSPSTPRQLGQNQLLLHNPYKQISRSGKARGSASSQPAPSFGRQGPRVVK